MVRLFTTADAERWDAYVSAHPRARSYHLTAWQRIIEESVGHRSYSLMSEDRDGRVNGVLPLVRLRSRLFGDFLVSVPYVNYGGACADDEHIVRELLGEAVRLGDTHRVDHVEIRTDTSMDYGLRVRSAKVSMRLPLKASSEELWKAFPAKLRSQIKRAQQEPVTVHVGREEELDAFYHVFAINMRDLGTPVYEKRFFRSILRELPDSTWICSVSLGGEPLAAGFLVGFRDTLEIPWASSQRRFNHLSPNMLLYWRALAFACEQGYACFDFGRSTPDSGPFRFKAQWGASPAPLYWHYWVRDNGAVPDLTPRNRRYRLAVRLWQHLPVAVTRVIGPPIVKNLP